MYVVSSILGFIAFLVSIYSVRKNKIEKFFLFQMLSNFLYFIHYLLLSATSGMFTKLISMIRDYIQVLKQKYKWLNKILFLFIIFYILIIYFTYSNIISILPVLSALIYTIFIWNSNINRVKLIFFICEVFWFIYNIYVLSIPGIISKCLSLLNTLHILVINKRI